MFSKSKKQKSEATMQQPKLRGMPALKHMRSTKREEYLLKKTKNGMPSISDLEQQNERQQMHKKGQFDDERHVQMKVDVVPASNYKPSIKYHLAHDSSAQCDKSENIGSGIAIHDEAAPAIVVKGVDNREMELGSPASNSHWRFSKGDSGYKSQGDNNNDQDKKKSKKTKRKNEARSRATSGLHDIKQQRKASRESVSRSMRALTPKERESIRFLENVIKIAKENDSADEVFNSDSDGDDNFEVSRDSSCMKINEDTDEAIDYGYASVNDVSRRFSIDSTESVGSIIDLVGNLSTSASSSTSPLYTAVDKPQRNQASEHDDASLEESIGWAEASKGANRDDDHDRLLHYKDPYSRDARKHYEEVLSHFDEVINSFCILSDEENIYEVVEETTETYGKEDISNKVEISSTECNREKGARETTSGNEVKEIKRKEKKYRDPEKEKERKERKKRKKEEKKAIKREQEQREENEARLREENIARHVDTITALTQDMIMTAKQEPIYAKVDKTRKRRKDENQNIKSGDRSDIIVPPPPFASDQTVQSNEANPHNEKFNSTPTPLASPGSQGTNELTFQEGHGAYRPYDEITESTGNCLNYANVIAPSLYKCHTTINTAESQLSPTLLRKSTENLRHVTPSVTSGKSIQIKPKNPSNSNETYVPNEGTNQSIEKQNAKSSTSSNNNFSRHLSPTPNCRVSRPLSLNLETIDKSLSYSSTSVKPYSSFREEKEDGGKRNNRKSKPFVVTALKKPVQLC